MSGRRSKVSRSSLLKMRFEESRSNSDPGSQSAPPRLMPTHEELQQILDDPTERENVDRNVRRAFDVQRIRRAASGVGVSKDFSSLKARPGEVSDVLKAVTKIPAVEKGLKRAREKALKDCERLSTGEKVAVASSAVLISAGAVAGALGTKTRRREVYDAIKDKKISITIPTTAIKVELKTGKEHMVLIGYDLMKLFDK